METRLADFAKGAGQEARYQNVLINEIKQESNNADSGRLTPSTQIAPESFGAPAPTNNFMGLPAQAKRLARSYLHVLRASA